MSARVYLVNKHTGKKFQVLGMDRENGTITLKGEMSTWQEPFDKERFKELGYERVVEEVEEMEDA